MQVFSLFTIVTLLFGNIFCSESQIFLISLGYFVSQVILNRTALPLGFDKFPSPSAIPIM